MLVPRSRERLESEIDRYHLIERDGLVIACAALHPYPAEGMGELASVAVHANYRGGRRGDKLLEHIERVARARGLSRLFVLTTQTAHWFQERGFVPAARESLPAQKQALYDERRNSLVFVKPLSAGG